MSSFSQIYRLSNCLISGYKTVLQTRTGWQSSILCNYTKKSAEEKLGIDKPKRPLTPFFKFMSQMRPALLAKNPGITAKEAIGWSSKHWQQLDAETKSQMAKEYEKDMEDYKKIKEIYLSSLTEDQKADIKRIKEEMAAVKEKRKQKKEFKEMGRPKKPMSSYFLFMQTLKDKFEAKNIKEYQQKVKELWAKLPGSEKVKLEKQAADLLAKYQKDLEAWELKMIEGGRMDLVRTSKPRARKPKTEAKTQ